MKQIAMCFLGTALFAVVFIVTPGIPAAAAGGEEPCIPPGMFVDGTWEPEPENGIYGTDGPDKLKGTEGCDWIAGYGGNDVIHGAEGFDLLMGDGGRDRIFGGKGGDLVQGGRGRDRLFGNRGGDFLNGGDGDDYIEGNEGNDGIFGDEGNDYLIGGKGDDGLTGGEGDDRLKGGPGADAFQFALAHGEDTVLDFEDGVDEIVICLGDNPSFDEMIAEQSITYGDDGEVILPVISAYFRADGESGVKLNLTRYGGGEIYIRNLGYSALDASDIGYCIN